MAPPPDPNPPDWDVFSGTPTEFNSAQTNAYNHGWNSTTMAILDASGVDNFLYFGKSLVTSGHVAWFFRNSSNGGSAPFCKIPSATFNVIKNGTLNTSTGVITYSGSTYLLDIRLDGSGNQIAYANKL